MNREFPKVWPERTDPRSDLRAVSGRSELRLSGGRKGVRAAALTPTFYFLLYLFPLPAPCIGRRASRPLPVCSRQPQVAYDADGFSLAESLPRPCCLRPRRSGNASRMLPPATPPTIAVLPFKNTSAAPDGEDLADGRRYYRILIDDMRHASVALALLAVAAVSAQPRRRERPPVPDRQ
jgi:hypothetical protein